MSGKSFHVRSFVNTPADHTAHSSFSFSLIRACVHAYPPSPICVAEHLAPFLPSHPVVPVGEAQAINAVAAAPFGSASILLISWAYIKMLGGDGLKESTKAALLNANYMAHRLKDHFTLRYKNAKGKVAHELLIDLHDFDKAAGIKVTDFAKRLQVCLACAVGYERCC